MHTRMVNVRGRIHEYGPRLEHAPADLVQVGRRRALACWCAPKLCHADAPTELAEDLS
ncbi:DUF4326 domain-containing protein [Streptomyces canus]|uniref:DUF4326 domain-containing protein n=1 Tax=Streptomyces canus TaxID=58343 RepID=UPI0027843AF2|nr:DUF4326 domain-containing protein [Streptomyces canus]MDQ1072358.1 hypothetical protein [Streptomyces canus]